MGHQNDFYRKVHPEQFSDSIVVKKGKLDRDFFDFYLETLTSKNLDKTFEEFCRGLAEAEICPNLMPQTGPTGGGDSKVDSETYPVSNQIAELWYYGHAAASERWAFAISAKKDWKSKVKSDVAKIVTVNGQENRGYTKIFFMSNQYISDKKRAETEDELRNQYGLDIRIMDRTWILDKVLSNPKNIEMTIKVFGFSDSFYDEIQPGARDLERKQEFEGNEQKISDTQTKQSELVLLARRNVILARELGYTQTQVLGLIERSVKISSEYGNVVDYAKALYEAAWTMYWWYEDEKRYYDFYIKYEKVTVENYNVNFFTNLITLWINLVTLSRNDPTIVIDEHTRVLKEEYARYTNDFSKPNTTIEAKAAYQLCRFFLGDDPDVIVDDIITILEKSSGHLDLDLRPLCHAIQEFPVFEDTKRYVEMFERSVDIMSERKQNIEAANLLASRGRKLKEKKPYDALVYFSRTLTKLYNEESKEELIYVVMEMADIFQSTGLLWAARNYYYYAFAFCLNQYFKYGTVSSILYLSAHALKYLELRLGHILYATGFHKLSLISEHVYPGNTKIKSDDVDNFDYALAIQILRTPFEVTKSLGALPAYLNEQGLSFSCVAMKYELGHYDKDMLADLSNSTDVFDDVISKWKDQPALKQLVNTPWYGLEEKCQFQTKVLGCSIGISFSKPYFHGEFEYAATILATVESFFGSGLPNHLVSLQGKIELYLKYDRTISELMQISPTKENPANINILFRDYNPENIVHEQECFAENINHLLADVISIMFPFPSEWDKIERMVKNDAAFDRASIFANSIFFGMEVLGKDTFLFDTVVHDYPHLEVQRDEKAPVTNIVEVESKDAIELPKDVVYEVPPDTVFKNVSNTNIHTIPIINIPAWNNAKWIGVMFLADLYHLRPPLLSFVFTTESGRTIFEEWQKTIGTIDSKNQIAIRIIKGIDRNHPFWYRVAVGVGNHTCRPNIEPFILSLPSRSLTMQPNSDANLKIFENELKRFRHYSLCPSYMPDRSTSPVTLEALTIQKGIDSIVIYEACDIPPNDYLAMSAILPTDEPIIPAGKENSPVVDMINGKRKIR